MRRDRQRVPTRQVRVLGVASDVRAAGSFEAMGWRVINLSVQCKGGGYRLGLFGFSTLF